MINRFLILVVTGVIALSTAALCADAGKDNLSIFLNTGYGAGIGGYEIGQTMVYNINGTLIKHQEHYLNYGGGINLSVGANYKLFDNLFAQAALRFAWGVPSIKSEFIWDATPLTSLTTTYKPGMWGVGITLLPRFRVLDMIDAYTGVGCGLYFSYCDIEYSRTSIKGSISTWPALGLTGLIGAEYPIMDELTLFGEITYDAMSFSISTYKHPNATLTSETTDHYVANSNSIATELSPYNIPGTNIALRIGARFIVF